MNVPTSLQTPVQARLWPSLRLPQAGLIAHQSLVLPTLRPFCGKDARTVPRLLVDIDALYPGATRWLEAKIDALNGSGPTCFVAAVGKNLVGLTIETPKGARKVKLSTIWVHPEWRRVGIGSVLMARLLASWRDSELDYGYVTVANGRVGQVEPLLHRVGFRLEAIERARYGAERDEYIYAWRPGHDSIERLRHSAG